MSDSAGYNVKAIVDVCNGADSMDPETRDASVEYLINNMVRFINYRQPYKNVRNTSFLNSKITSHWKVPR